MKKKNIAMLTSLALGGTLLFGTALVNASQLSGYETYKGAVMDTKNLKNETAALKVSITDNGTTLADLTENLKQNQGANAMSSITTIKTANTTKTISNYLQDGKRVQKSSDSSDYLVSGTGNKKFQKKEKTENPQVVQGVGVIIDTLVGSMKDGVTASANGDGTKKVNIQLSDSQVTPLVNALVSIAMAKDSNEFADKNEKADMKNLKNVIPQLQSDVKVVSVNSTADISKDDTIADQTAKIVISGKDAAGKVHTIEINANMELSNINSTTPDKVDLTGKQVKTMENKFR
ncbi:hypothetical protein [Clostridium fungisolvens]|uniref:Uncharacterized protein n=1 Tax=Clostridium fungisolvens TaxID=1604897 RepID=A0A6V8SDG3_9CLOT|nr:hypothetical protein [Clostridium fungisolvens]GFP74592.1 hypothetical protein bsdtw1_00647 [Clostridium fungisolvens]